MNNKNQNFDELPTGEIISYEHFLYQLDTGREIEFSYNNQEYFIAHDKKGRVLWKGKNRLSEYYDDKNETFLSSVQIEGVTLKELINKKLLRISTVF
ncbi:hypothetical protein [Amphibacillus jilinensis]|uniref:hypothetical protein n=1 Tax=Amphibacillus jilinensis TaxID=1216008 RepID=UPI00031EB98C|nr:hypothetical protein [Amphibacillus jilinensis]